MTMKKDEMERLTLMIAEKTAEIVIERLNSTPISREEDDDYVTSQEAAHILGVTPNYLRSMKYKFPHKKVGNQNQGRVLFKKSGLFENYVK